MSTVSNPTKKSTAAVVAPFALGVVSLAAVFGGVSTIIAANASGTPADQVAICHATGSQTNPYNESSVDTSSIDNYKKAISKKPEETETPTPTPTSTPTPTPTPSESSSDSPSPSSSSTGNGNGNGGGNNVPYLNGHGDHTGPVFAPGASRWGDIIPPFTSAQGTIFLGYNWTSAGQAILSNGCNYVAPTPTDSGSATPTGSVSPTATTSGTPTPTSSVSGTPATTPPTVTTGGTTGGTTPGGAPAPETAGGVPGAVEVVIPEVVAPLPGTVAMPAPLAVSPGTVAGTKVTAVPAGTGELVLSLAGISLLGGGIAGISGSTVWLYDRRRKTT